MGFAGEWLLMADSIDPDLLHIAAVEGELHNQVRSVEFALTHQGSVDRSGSEEKTGRVVQAFTNR